MSQQIKLTDLPSDVLYLIFPYLGAVDYVRLTSCTRALFPYRGDLIFWRALTRRTFRIPDQPLLQEERWKWLYKKLLTQTHLYTWGNNASGNLGHEGRGQAEGGIARPNLAPRARRLGRRYPLWHGWPKEAVIDEEQIGIVADVQCGGWSTTILNSIGAIYMFGILDGQRQIRRADEDAGLRKLMFPPAYPPTTNERYEPSTAIQQFSTGRSTVLGLADDNKVWMWESLCGFQIKPMHVDLVQNKVTRVAAGWDRNSMYVMNIGIVYWTSSQDSDVIRGGRQEALAVADMMLIDTVTVPGSGYRRKKDERFVEDSVESRIGEVTNHVVLEGYIVFTTDLNKLFCYRTTYPMPALDVPEPVELTTLYTASTSKSFSIRDIQGSYRRFAIFTHDGCVLTASNDLLNAFWNAATSPPTEEPQPLPSPTLLHSPQSRTITSLAFGDWHYLALHSDGTITSYGQELKSCGALGLGEYPASKLRGIRPILQSFGNQSLPEGEGRTVWIEPLMDTYLNDMAQKPATLDFDRKTYADHFEQEGAKWEQGITSEGEMGAYFVLKIAAAGWSSAALVLVDEEKAERARKAHIVTSSPPHPPSPTLSAQSVDSKGFAYEVIDSPGEQLVNAIHAVGSFVWRVGRWFLGLTERDAARAAIEAKDKEREEDKVRYTWSDDPFPELILANLPDDGVLHE